MNPADLAARFDSMPLAERERLLKATVRQLHEENENFRNLFDGAKKQLLQPGAIVAVREHTVLLATADGLFSTVAPKHIRPAPKPGAIVWCDKDGTIFDVETDSPPVGSKLKVLRVVREGLLEVHGDDVANRLVIDATGAKPGDEVVLDGSLAVVAHNLGGHQQVSELAFTEDTGVTWDDIAGQEDSKRTLREAIEGPVLHAEVYKAFGKAPCKGILLYGPPGNGKTLFAKAIATEIGSRKGGQRSGFIYVKGPEVLQGIVGQSEGKVRKLFAAARDHHEAHGYPAVVCIDEADAILGKRTDSKISMEKTIVPQFLAEMDGIDPSGALVVLLTNRPDTLDPAVTREGRIDLKIGITRPTKEDSQAILSYHLGKRLLAPGADRDLLAKETAASLFSPRHVMYMVRVIRGMDARIGLDRFVSGAMCAGIVDRATVRAIRRHLGGDEPKGITAEDLDEAVKETPGQIKALAHGDELGAVLDEFGGKENIRKVEAV
jgi:AAA+ superfamily predicted ATPase